jgi:ubiquinone/menaquinone biosynthesis C-methylase UbiE
MNNAPPSNRHVPGDALATVLDALRQLVADSAEGIGASPEAVKGCCAGVYGLDLVELFLGDSYHPGGSALTRRLADVLDLRPGQEVLDLAAGTGTTAFLLARERGVNVTGIDLGAVQVGKARARASQFGLAQLVSFQVGDAEHLPVDDERFDAVICECAFCTFPDKHTAAGEMARVLRPGGKVGITDVWLEPDRLGPELAGMAGRIACLADAKPIAVLHNLLATAGLHVTTTERHDQVLVDTIERVQARLRALKIAGLPGLDRHALRRAFTLAGKAASVVARGDAGYLLMVAVRAQRHPPGAGHGDPWPLSPPAV